MPKRYGTKEKEQESAAREERSTMMGRVAVTELVNRGGSETYRGRHARYRDLDTELVGGY